MCLVQGGGIVQSIWIIGGALVLFAMYMVGVDWRWLGAGSIAWLGASFNSMVHVRNQADTAFSTIQVMLKKRFDLVPALIDTVQRYMEHESDVLEEVVRVRAMAGDTTLGTAEAASADSATSSALGRLLATAEAYPELKADSGFQNLQRALNEVEEQISAARRSYNMAAKHHNDAVRMFPTNLLATLLRFQEKDYFETPAQQQQPHDVMARFRSHREEG
jgi:LemA protein